MHHNLVWQWWHSGRSAVSQCWIARLDPDLGCWAVWSLQVLTVSMWVFSHIPGLSLIGLYKCAPRVCREWIRKWDNNVWMINGWCGLGGPKDDFPYCISKLKPISTQYHKRNCRELWMRCMQTNLHTYWPNLHFPLPRESSQSNQGSFKPGHSIFSPLLLGWR